MLALIKNLFVLSFDMKKFIVNLFLFVAPFVLLSYFLDIFVSKNLKNINDVAYGEYSTWNDLFDGKVNSDIVIYGSSRAWCHISPKIIEDNLRLKTYNLGINGHNFWLENFRHAVLFENNTKPKLILFSLDMFTLQKRKELFNSEQFLPYMLWNSEIKKATESYEGFNFYDYTIPLIRYCGKILVLEKIINYSLGLISNPIMRINGYQGKDKTWNSDLDKAIAKRKKYEVPIDRKSQQLFEKFLVECQNQNIKLIFVYTPEYIGGQKFVKNRKTVMDLYGHYSKKYQIPFYDYSNDSISFQKKYFYNASHLNKTGAELFTHQFVDTLRYSSIIKELKADYKSLDNNIEKQ